MPLIHGKSPKAFEQNLKSEMHSGKPQKQALAIAYSMKRRAKKMASGGDVASNSDNDSTQTLGKRIGYPGMAEGGEVENEKLHPDHEPRHSMRDPVKMAMAILRKKDPSYADGGDVESQHDEDTPDAKKVAMESLRNAFGGASPQEKEDLKTAHEYYAYGKKPSKVKEVNYGGHYAHGGMAEPELSEHELAENDDDFLTDEDQSELPHHHMEGGEEMEEEHDEGHDGMIAHIMKKLRAKHYGGE